MTEFEDKERDVEEIEDEEEFDDDVIVFVDENGNEQEYDIVLTFYDEGTDKDYILYADGELDDEGMAMVYASTYVYNEETGELDLEEVVDEAEVAVVNAKLEELDTDDDLDDLD
ncbi:Uncharacterized protein conserved in bacteria [Slackia heliotrinireducens]|uniref:DUF1292 domain-containing protein n=1 Tax=Slackia heliotrinireducens (strain ATCC 29202 / DSM 20476 / NCTC 11029 / RHS 1) TaxID=471855 RepID=C7N5F7_SLAHD|nr:DUF1292 domain-containing protein [Slackia heliotrinireducens]ACV22142.1 Protein of unknown function (DUF1292) [Slackia heliotrinireducens DSM 20476]VEH00186.1 Uncharacterized protein conserved in bacteria [Slackia heliotrinireducens]